MVSQRQLAGALLLLAQGCDAFILPDSASERLRTSPLGIQYQLAQQVDPWVLVVPEAELIDSAPGPQATNATAQGIAPGKGTALKYGYKIPLTGESFYARATRFAVAEGEIYLLKMQSAGAHFLEVEFEHSHFPEGTHMCVYASDTLAAQGAPSGAELRGGRKPRRHFAYFDGKLHFRAPPVNGSTQLVVPPVHSDELVMEVFVSAGAGDALPELTFTKAIHAFVDVFKTSAVAERGLYGDGPSCMEENNIKCFPEYETESRGVLLFLNGNSLCSGSLVNNVFEGISGQRVLTAAHCLPFGLDTMTLFVFNYYTSQCDGSSGSADDAVSGSVLLGSEDEPDVAILRITQAIPDDFNVIYNGWETFVEANPSSMPQGFGIHHPGGDYMKASVTNGAPYVWGSVLPAGTLHKWTVEWGDGITAPGSSGSPLFNSQSRLIVGPLCCGGSFCDAPQERDWYGSLTQVYETLVKPHLAGGEDTFSLGKAGAGQDGSGPDETIPSGPPITPEACVEAGGFLDWVGDGYCDYEGDPAEGTVNNNIPECQYDGGDCCAETCIPLVYLCGYNGLECANPLFQSSGALAWIRAALVVPLLLLFGRAL